jgi:hypothetical protein
MSEYNLFELTKLTFDPPENSAKKVKETIEKTEKYFNTMLFNESQPIARNEINEKLAFLKIIKNEIFTSDGKLNKRYEELTKEHLNKEIEKLKVSIRLYKTTGNRSITNGKIFSDKRNSNLSKENIEKAYKDEGIEIININPLAAMPKFPTNADKIFNDLAVLRKIKDPNPNAADLAQVTDMYAFTAYLEGESDNVSEYRAKTSSELFKILDKYAKEFSTRNDLLGKLKATLATAGKTHIFNSDDNRKAYELYLLYKSPALTEIFDILKRESAANLKDSKYAEMCIKTISNYFPDNDAALSIYNFEAGLRDDPYIPEKMIFRIKCPHCNYLVEFANLEEAQKINKCKNCGKPLYQLCKRCNKHIQISSEKCMECGYILASMTMFVKYYSAAEKALRYGDFNEARQQLANAKIADPGEKTLTSELTKLIENEEKIYEKPINELRQLIAEKKYSAAADTLVNTIKEFPKLNISSFEKEIKSSLAEAQSMFNNAKTGTTSKCADICLDILDICRDFKPAKDFLQENSPNSVNNVNITVDSKNSSVIINWNRSAERGITYSVVRKTGKVAPKNENDGDSLIDGTSDCNFNDQKLIPGAWYAYSIFAKRINVYSNANSNSISLSADVIDLNHELRDTTLHISWTDPQNSSGVTITRKQNNREIVLVENAHYSYEDKNLEYNKAYSYALRANYNGLPQSPGISFVVTPMVSIDQFQISVIHLKNNKYKVSWGINRQDIKLRILANKKAIHELKTDKKECEIELPADGFYNIEVSALSGGNWLLSQNSVSINTYSSCKLDNEKLMITEIPINGKERKSNIELRMKLLGTIPNNAAAFWYVIRTKSSLNNQPPWADHNEITNAADVHRMTIDQYKKNNELIFTETAQETDSYYMTLFTVYNVNGKEVISAPYKQRIFRPLKADIFWKVSKNILGNSKLSIEIEANRPFVRLPQLALCSSNNNQHLLSCTDVKAEILLKVQEKEIDIPQQKYKDEYKIQSKIAKNSKLFLFETEPVLNESFTMRWADGFLGKEI